MLCSTATNEIFARDLLAEAAAQKPSGNLVVSPLSVLVALSVAYAGARGSTMAEYRRRFLGCADARSLSTDDYSLMNIQLDSLHRTLSQLNHVSHAHLFSPTASDSDAATPLRLFQRLYIRPGAKVDPEYRQKIGDELGCEIADVGKGRADLVADQINADVRIETNGAIDRLVLAEGMDELEMSIVSAAQFRGKWKREFRDTAQWNFETADKTMRRPTMMFGTVPANESRYIEREDHQSLTLRFADSEGADEVCHRNATCQSTRTSATMTIILPKRGVHIDTLLRDGAARMFSPVAVDAQRKDIGAVNVIMPEFRVALTSNMVEDARRLGLGSPFSPTRADLRGIQNIGVDVRRLHFHTFAHSSRVDIGKGGEEKALPSGAIIKGAVPKFHVQRPFAFGIHTEDGTPLFVGVIRDPTMGLEDDD